MHHSLRKVTVLCCCVATGFALHGCTNRLGPVYATQTAGGPDNPNLSDNTIEHTKECMETYGRQLETGRTLLESKVDLNESGDIVNVTISGIPETAPDFGACVRNVLRDITVPGQSFREAVARLKYRREHVIAEDSVVNLPGVTITASVPILSSDLVLEADAYSLVLQVSVKVVDKVVKPIDLDKQTLVRLGRAALDGLGYDEIIKRAEKLGWVKMAPIDQTLSATGKSFIGDGAVVAAQDRAVKLFTRYAVVAGIASQADSPLPGLGDVVGLGILVAGMLHAGGVMVDEIIAAEQAQATASATPTATTTTTAPPITIAVPRRYPGQTCDDNKLDELEGAMKAICKGFPGDTCRQINRRDAERLQAYPCSLLKARIPALLLCVAARRKIQDVCFKGSPEPGHEQQIDDLTKGIALCEALKLVNCASGHPMSGL